MKKTLVSCAFIFLLSACVSPDSQQGVSVQNGPHPIVTKQVSPFYPAIAAKKMLDGSVTLKFDIDKQGRTKNIQVISSQPGKIFDRAAKNALKKWIYKPKFENGVAVEQKAMTVILDFRLERGEEEKTDANKHSLSREAQEQLSDVYTMYGTGDLAGAIVAARKVKVSARYDKIVVSRILGTMLAGTNNHVFESISLLKIATESQMLNKVEQAQSLRLLALLYMQTQDIQNTRLIYDAWRQLSHRKDRRIEGWLKQNNA